MKSSQAKGTNSWLIQKRMSPLPSCARSTESRSFHGIVTLSSPSAAAPCHFAATGCGSRSSGKGNRKGGKIISKEALEQLVETEAQRIVTNSDAVLHGQFRFWSSNDRLPENEFVYAPFYKDVRFAAGYGSQENEDNNGFQIPFGRATLYRHGVQPNDVIAASVTGDSMEPRLYSGDTIGIDTGSRTIRNGEIYAVVNQGELLIKQCFKVGKTQIRLHSYNPGYLDIYLPVEEVEVIGRVFWVSAML